MSYFIQPDGVPIGSGFSGTNISGTVNSNGVALSIGAGGVGDGGNVIAAGASTANSTGTIVFSNSNGVSFGLNGATVTASHNGLTSQSVQTQGTFDTTALNAYQLTSATSNIITGRAGTGTTFSGANISGSMTVNTGGVNLSLSVAAGGAGDGGNIIAASGSTANSTGTIVFSNANGVSFGLNGNTMTASVSPSGAAGSTTHLTYQNRELGASGSAQFTNNQLWLVPFRVPANVVISASTGQWIQSISGSFTSAVAATHAETMQWCLYSNDSTNLTQFASATSGSLTWQVWNSGTSSASWAYNGSTSSSAGTAVLTQAAGVRNMIVPFNGTIGGGIYIMAFNQSTSTAGYSGLISRYAHVCDSPMPLAMGLGFGSGTATSIGFVDAGTYSVTTTAFPSTVGVSQIRQHSNLIPFFKVGAI